MVSSWHLNLNLHPKSCTTCKFYNLLLMLLIQQKQKRISGWWQKNCFYFWKINLIHDLIHFYCRCIIIFDTFYSLSLIWHIQIFWCKHQQALYVTFDLCFMNYLNWKMQFNATRVYEAEPRSWFPLSVVEQPSRIPDPRTEIEFAPQRSAWFLPFALPALFVQRTVTATVAIKTSCIVHWILERLRFRPHNVGLRSWIWSLNNIPCAKQSYMHWKQFIKCVSTFISGKIYLNLICYREISITLSNQLLKLWNLIITTKNANFRLDKGNWKTLYS